MKKESECITTSIDNFKFSKEQILNSKQFKGNVDVINAILEDGKQYTVAEIAEKINNYLKGTVK